MTIKYSVTHISWKLSFSFESFTRELEAALGKLDVTAPQKVGHDAEATQKQQRLCRGGRDDAF